MTEIARTVASHAGRPVYVDVMAPEMLEAVVSTLDEALGKEPRKIWPATVPNEALEFASLRDRHKQLKLEDRLMLVPLARLGVPQGFSGSSVFIGYFTDDTKRYLPSRPVVIKIGKKESLEDELRQARSWPPHAHGDDRHFAYPFHIATSSSLTEERTVLVAPFSSADKLDKHQTGYELKLRDLYSLLISPSETVESLLQHLNAVYTLMHGIHRNGLVKCSRVKFTYSEQYEKYIRKLHTDRQNIPLAIFGNEDKTTLFGAKWPNPIKVFEGLWKIVSFEGTSGPVHGDLHPKNIVLDNQNSPNIIDFGWAQSSGHLVKDYALMEANLRAVTLPSHLKAEDVVALSKMLAIEDALPTGSDVITSRARLIREGIWKSLERGNIVDDWNREYLVPLFLISYGLLKHLDDARNQQALVSTILSLSERIDQVCRGNFEALVSGHGVAK